MKRFLKRAAVLALCLTMILGLTSCGSLSNLIKSGFDASGYVEGILDCTYKGEYEEVPEADQCHGRGSTVCI